MQILKNYNNEKGFALILALSMLAIMSILGAFALMTSTTEIQISGNYNASQRAFFAAERTLEVGEALMRNTGDPFGPLLDDLTITGAGPAPNETNTVELLRSGPAPGFGSDFRGNYYIISVVGGTQFDATGNPRLRTRLESQRMNLTFASGSGGAQLGTRGVEAP